MDGTNNKIRCMECGAVIPEKEPDYGEFIKTGLCRKCTGAAQSDAVVVNMEVKAILEDMEEDISIVKHFMAKLAINLDKINNLLQ